MGLDLTLYEAPFVLDEDNNDVEDANICCFDMYLTHNLNTMAGEAGIYECLWHPERGKIVQGRQLIPFLEAGLKKLIADPEKYKEFNPANGFGTYDGLVSTLKKLIKACKEFPDSYIEVSI